MAQTLSTQSPALSCPDFSILFEQEEATFLQSKLWGKLLTNYRRQLKMCVADGDVDALITFLHDQRQKCQDEFKTKSVYMIWHKCFNLEENRFENDTFMQKLYTLDDGQIEPEELEDFFSYYCLTKEIDHLLTMALKYKEQLTSGHSVRIDKMIYANGSVTFGNAPTPEPEPEDSDGEPLENDIFNRTIFASNARLIKLRKVIAHFVNLGEYNVMFGELNPVYLDPQQIQSDWYYIHKSMEEALVCRKHSVSDFIKQMIKWFPFMFEFKTAEEMTKTIRKIEKSISAEKRLWKMKDGYASFADMYARYSQLGFDKSKLDRINKAAQNGLCLQLKQLKQEFQRQDI